ncbi:replicative DNA helicase [Sphingomonas metalli]|uniref:Replicative DNA helicase n=1 Tax=Sphingomonas metalli TaxID=1779358 RepID=A0A916SWR1_9SPHN|nr:cyclopropane-fatty-acyl-phospholipid synthase family protein [Sphingomonas metalli]GGB20431.1 replicative DNA helicase [Sphingomonas metalli]
MALIDTFLARQVRRGRLTLTHADSRTIDFGTPDPAFPTVAIRFTEPGVAGRIVRHPALGAAEAFMDGKLVIEQGDVRDLVNLLKGNSPWERGGGLRPSMPIRLAGQLIHRVDRINMARRSKRNVAHHYDLSDRLYALFLDADRQYSCAYFTDPANGLEQAQADKKAHIVAKLLIEPGMRVLDIGCGWGGMALYIHAKTGAEVLGVTLSEEQLKVARRRAEEAGVADRVRFELIDYRAVTGQFDRIVSVGMFEHVGPAHYGTFFRKCRELLADEGVMLLHTIGRMGGPGVTDSFTTKYIFPGGYNPALSEIVRGYEGTRLFPTDFEVLRVHYAMTIDHWYDRTVAAKDAIVALYDERFYRLWTFYLAGAAEAFRTGGMCNYQVQLSKSRRAVPLTRDYIGEAEARLRGQAYPPPQGGG